MGVTKTGKGTWTLLGNQTFSGPLAVEDGTLLVARKRKYTWFRFTVRGVVFPTSNKDIFYINEFGLFNSAGERQNQGLEAISSGTGRVKNSIDYMTLLPGQATIGNANEIYWWSEDWRNLNGLFDGEGSGKYWRTAYYGFSISWDNEATHIPVVMRLPADADEVSSCDVVLYSSSQSLTDFSVDGSVDGIVWKNLLNKRESEGDFDHTTTSKWLSDNSAYPTVGDTHIPAESWRFVGHDGGDDCSVLENVSGVNVAPGATLRAADDITLHRITIDATNGNGTIDGFDFAETGVIDVVNMPSRAGSAVVSITLSNLPEGALARLNGWSVRIGGRASSATVAFDGSKATVTRPGISIIVK
ncbi:MAG: autotransporter-associated beta strand repeat-containing protein [Kiritimatiellae bacterium]|nr:autotransporter-associated beta strand repeat-containing protein [Kiritimatiellia bacterium]